jgi:hypothetical protein
VRGIVLPPVSGYNPGMRVRCLVPVLVGAFFVGAQGVPTALASEPLSDRNLREVRLQVNRGGEALITYTRSDGRSRRVLVWAALNAGQPDPAAVQIRFHYDYSGGYGKYRKAYWKRFRNACRPYAGPALPWLVAACQAPDGSFWALQGWQRRLPLLGFAPFLPDHADVELHVSHWSGPLPQLEVFANWTYEGAFQGLFGRLTYLGMPVHGFGTTPTGNPRDRYGRNLYIDTYNSAYGPGWQRESGIVAHRPTGTFCHSFVPQKPFPGYPSQQLRPAASGERYRVTVSGPGVTPVIVWEGAGLGGYAPSRDEELNAQFDRIMAGDAICRGER